MVKWRGAGVHYAITSSPLCGGVGGQLYTEQKYSSASLFVCVALVSVCRQVATAAPAAPAKQSPHKQLRGRQSMPTISYGNIIIYVGQ